MIRVSRGFVLIILAALTLIFLWAAYIIWNNDIPAPMRARISNVITTPSGATASPLAPAITSSISLTVYETGIAAVSAPEIHNANLEFDNLSDQNLNLTYMGESVPFFVAGEGENAHLLFYAQAHTSALEAPAVYKLERGPGSAMSQRNASPDGRGTPSAWQNYLWEEESLFVESASDGDLWTGVPLLAGGSWAYTFEDIQIDQEQATLILRLLSEIDSPAAPDHHVKIFLNDEMIADHFWDGTQRENIQIELAKGMLETAVANTITILSPNDTDIVGDTIYIDSIQLKYLGTISTAGQRASFSSDSPQIAVQDATESTLVFDVTNATAPIVLTNLRYENNAIHFASDGSQRQYFALDTSQTIQPKIESISQWEKSLRDSSWSADYIAIVPSLRGFQTALNPLLEYRAQQGLRTVSVPLEQIFEEFGYGHRSPAAIQAFLAYASKNWTPPAPHYVLLAGDATYDLRDQISGANKNLLPTPMVHTEFGRYLASDGWYVRFAQDAHTHMAIGRFPAQNPIQLRNMVNKTLQYENGTILDTQWAERVLLIADDQPEFEAASSNITTIMRDAGFDAYQLNMRNNTYISHDIISTINRGVGIINYSGYGGERVWGDEAVLQTSDVLKLKNAARPPILTTFTTRNGAFADPQQDTLVESLLQAENRGIVAAVAPSGRPLMDRQIPLAEQFYMQLVNLGVSASGEGPTLGDVLLHMQNNLPADPALQEIMPTLNLLGDPALKIHLP